MPISKQWWAVRCQHPDFGVEPILGPFRTRGRAEDVADDLTGQGWGWAVEIYQLSNLAELEAQWKANR